MIRLQVLLLCLLSVFRQAEAQQRLFLTDPLEPLYPDSNSLPAYGNAYTADFPSNVPMEVNLLLQLPLNETFTVSATCNGKPVGANAWFRLIDVPVEQNTGLDSRTEQFRNTRNPYVIRRAPFRVYEAIEPLGPLKVTTRSPFTALRLSIPPESLPGMGKQVVKISVRSSRGELQGRFTAERHPVKLPALKDARFFYTNWFSMRDIETRYALTRWSDDWFAMLDRYAALMAQGRQNAILVPGELISLREGRITLDEERMIRYVNLFRAHGFSWFESPHIMDRGKEDDWGDPVLKVALTGARYDTETGRRQVDTVSGLIAAFTRRHGLAGRWLQHISDEPTEVQAACYKQVVAHVKRIFPETRIMEATNARDGLVGGIDLWCPLINDFQPNEAFFREREATGEKVLVYTCLIPGGPWLNRLLDQERIRQVYFGWGAARYNTFGYLHWGLNQYAADPWTQSVVHHPSPVATPENFLPAGDTHVVYPGKDGPLSSVRFEAHRQGIEDFELLADLKKKDPARASAIISGLFRSYTDYETSLASYRNARRQLLKALSDP